MFSEVTILHRLDDDAAIDGLPLARHGRRIVAEPRRVEPSPSSVQTNGFRPHHRVTLRADVDATRARGELDAVG
jgi:hypothetical protein